jgi:hypothetical protein
MVLYRFSFPLFEDVRRIAIFGFSTSCLATAFGLGYGYIFKGLQENSAILLFSLRAITTHIDHLSKPGRISYTNHLQFIGRVDELQHKMFDLIESRHKLATHLSSGKPPARPFLQPIIIAHQPVNSKKKPFFIRIWHSVPFGNRKKGNNTNDENGLDKNFEAAYSLSEGEIFYFAEQSQKIGAIRNRIQEHRKKIKDIEHEIHCYWRNEETYRSLNDQIKNTEKRIQYRENELMKLHEQLDGEQKVLKILYEERKVLLSEGYYTGTWFNTNGPSDNGSKENNTLPEPSGFLN